MMFWLNVVAVRLFLWVSGLRGGVRVTHDRGFAVTIQQVFVLGGMVVWRDDEGRDGIASIERAMWWVRRSRTMPPSGATTREA